MPTLFKQWVKQGICKTFDLLQWTRIIENHLKKRGQHLVLNFHRVSEERHFLWEPLKPQLFESLIKHLKDRFPIILFPTQPERLPQESSVVLSFDDGYADFYDIAMPILSRLKVPANQNVVVTSVMEGRPPWHTELYDLIRDTPLSKLRSYSFPRFDSKFFGSTQEELRKFIEVFRLQIRKLNRQERLSVLNQIREDLKTHSNFKPTRMMNLSEVLEASKSHQIGCHSFDHDILGYENLETFREDYFLCKKFFDETLKLPLRIYAFPGGRYKNEQIQFLESQGVIQSLVVDDRKTKHLMGKISRITLYGDSTSELKLRAVGFFEANESAFPALDRLAS